MKALRGSIAGEVKRVVDKQLVLAIDELRATGARRSDDFVRRIKRLWRPARIASSGPGKRAPWRAA